MEKKIDFGTFNKKKWVLNVHFYRIKEKKKG